MQLIFGQKQIPVSTMESKAYDMEGNNMWFKQGKFPINLQAESQGELMDGCTYQGNYIDRYWMFKTNFKQEVL